MNCPNCFKELGANQKFCPYCGTKISEPEYAPTVEPEYDEVKTVAADFDELPELEPAQPVEQPIEQPVEQPVWQQPVEQPAQPYQPVEQPVQQYQPAQQPAQPYQPTEQPAQPYQPDPISPKKDFSQQYQQYQQGSGMAGTRQGDGSLPPDKNKTPLIIAIVIAAVVLIGAGVFAAIWIFGGCDKKGDDSSSSSSSSQSTEADSSKTGDDSSTAGGDSSDSSDFFGSDTQSSQSSAWSFDSSDTDFSSAPVPKPENSNVVVNHEGLELAEDSAIDSGNSVSESKITSALKASNMNDKIELGIMTVYIYAQGNALVYEYKYAEPISSTDRAEVMSNVKSLPSKSTQTLTTLRTQTGVSDMVMIYAYVDSDGTLITSAVCK